MSGIQDRSIIVTGSGSGIGHAAAILFAQKGAKLTLADRNASEGERVLEEVRAAGGTAQFVATDIADPAQVKAMVAKAVETYGRLDGAFNNAGIPNVGKRTHELEYSDWQRMIDINLSGTFYCIKHEVEEMLKTGGGAIVNTCSVAGLVNVPGTAEYTAAKHGVAGLTKAAAVDYGHDNIRINAIAPGTVYTELFVKACEVNPQLEEFCKGVHPIGRFSQPSEQAEAALWLLTDAASFVTGIIMPVDGGYTAV
ncbi:SDR family NAD(P)-dependent oxidoreductase [Novosphingobium sp. 9U]|uniref:SDR family NAD(P)-dependent oxidoreductase n=1 Tax=Novosphingobium sp. 9U TaxID=2653158 RepID=UPI0012F37B0C|nr:glucose 1-dehydrogenase [Novosphingobium sp. 9U]VWX50045.1 2,5-dichloro-2,5-cyclohexadiene-1,4-diol dehydrogenase [Novosphingobium sp. 9U]